MNSLKLRQVLFTALAFLPLFLLEGQIFPLEDNNFDSPQFKNRFLGSYGFNSEVEPQVSRVEAELLQSLYDMLRGGRLPEAMAALQASLTEESSAALEYTLGNLLFQSGDIQQAIKSYQKSIRKFPSFLRAYANLGRVYIQSGNYDEARGMLSKALELGGADADLFGLLGFANLNLGNYDSAVTAYDFARLIAPVARDWQVGRVQALLMSERYDAAIPALLELLDKYPEETRFYLNLANAYLGKGNYENTAQVLEIVRRVGKASPSSLFLLGDIYTNDSLYNLALPVYLEAFADPKAVSPSRRIRVARLFFERNALDEAAVILEQLENDASVSLSDDDRFGFLSLRAQIKIAQGNVKEAKLLLEQVLEEDPINGRTLLILANLARDEGDYERAAFYYDRAQALSDFRSDAMLQHGRMLVSQKQFDKALPLLKQVLLLKPSENLQKYVEAIESILNVVSR